ncbi:DEAD/DEAH box helicase [Candidatus Margulisiibacteriota bacterium]
MNKNDKENKATFHDLGIAPKIIEHLDRLKFTIPTPIQYKAIPLALEGKDLVGIAQTGTGKTLAFGIPMIQMILEQRGIGLILAPTRELALQVEEALYEVGRPYRIKTSVLIGGSSINTQIRDLKNRPHIIIATPGRLIDHIQRRTVKLFDVKFLVLDEADRMLDMGFARDIDAILKVVPKKRQTMLFSATMPPNIIKIATQHMQLPVSVEIAPHGSTAENIQQEVFIVGGENKRRLLIKLLAQYPGLILIFSRTKHGAKKLNQHLRDRGVNSAEIHSNRTLAQRREALEGFRSGKYRVLVATDIASRGIDVTNIEVVINYDLPDETDAYVHRIGRTARAGKAGRAISFATPDQGGSIRRIEKLIRMEMQVSEHPEILSEKFDYSLREPGRFNRGQGHRPAKSFGPRPKRRKRFGSWSGR